MWNADLEAAGWTPNSETDAFYRNGDGDELFFVHEGSGKLETVFGTVPFTEHDYIYVPRGATYRFSLDSTPQLWLVFHTPGEVETPNRYRNRYGQLLESAPYSQREFHPPGELVTHREGGDHEVVVRVGRPPALRARLPPVRRRGLGRVGVSVHLQRPRLRAPHGQAAPPPPTHQTFQGPNFVICSFCPRELDYDPAAVPLPYHHSNVHSEEIIYYVSGEFGSRKGIEVGSITVHPSGLPARTAARARREGARSAAHRGAGGDVGHVPAAAS